MQCFAGRLYIAELCDILLTYSRFAIVHSSVSFTILFIVIVSFPLIAIIESQIVLYNFSVPYFRCYVSLQSVNLI